MKSENFVAFFTISGFFIGLTFSLLKTQTLLDFSIYTISITLFFYLFIHIILILFFSMSTLENDSFSKKEYENQINLQIDELKIREIKIEEIINNIKNLKA